MLQPALPAQEMNETLLLQIADEGEALYKMELLSWLSSDYLRDRKDLKSLRGFLSYRQGSVYKCIYWNGAYDNLEVVYSFTSLNPEENTEIQVDDVPRKLTPHESLLYDIKMRAMLEIRGNTEMFAVPQDMQLSLHFIEEKSRIKAYAFLGTMREGLIPLGNDFVMFFDKSGELLSLSRIHPTFMPIYTDFQPDETGKLKTFSSTMGTSVPYISPTTIAVLLLYSDNKAVHEHTVLSDQYLSLYYLADKSLLITRNEGSGKN